MSPQTEYDAALATVKKIQAQDPLGYKFVVCQTVATRDMAPAKQVIVVQDVVAAILVSRGNLARMAGFLHRSRGKLRNFIESNEHLQELFSDQTESMVDKAQDNVYDAIEAGDVKVSQHYLDRLGKNRGYTTRLETTGSDGGPQQVSIDVGAELLEKLAKAGLNA